MNYKTAAAEMRDELEQHKLLAICLGMHVFEHDYIGTTILVYFKNYELIHWNPIKNGELILMLIHKIRDYCVSGKINSEDFFNFVADNETIIDKYIELDIDKKLISHIIDKYKELDI